MDQAKQKKEETSIIHNTEDNTAIDLENDDDNAGQEEENCFSRIVKVHVGTITLTEVSQNQSFCISTKRKQIQLDIVPFFFFTKLISEGLKMFFSIFSRKVFSRRDRQNCKHCFLFAPRSSTNFVVQHFENTYFFEYTYFIILKK